MTPEQRIENAKEMIRPLDRDGKAQIAAFLAMELGAMAAADEFRAAVSPFVEASVMTPFIEGGEFVDAYHRSTRPEVEFADWQKDADIRGGVQPGWNE